MLDGHGVGKSWLLSRFAAIASGDWHAVHGAVRWAAAQTR
jgi:hypothetical protein